jgi:hypothetical protein
MQGMPLSCNIQPNPVVMLNEYVGYKTKKGKFAKVHITNHAKKRYCLRRRILWGSKVPRESVVPDIQFEFSQAVRCSVPKSRLRKNKNRRQPDTIYFQNSRWRFVVRDGVLLTIEFFGINKDLNRFNSYRDFERSKLLK